MKLAWLDSNRSDRWTAVLLMIVVVGLPLVVSDRFYLNLMFLIFLYAGVASAWNLLGGYAGQFSLGHTAFFGIGAYTSTLLYNMTGVSPWVGMLVGVFLSMILAFLISYPAFRLRGVFFAIVTIAMGETVRILLLWARGKFNIPYGLSIDFQPGLANMIFADQRSYAWLAGGFMLMVTAACFLISRSRTGYYLQALRDNEDAAQASGINLRHYKLIAFLLSAGFTSIGGTLMAQYVLYIEPSTVFNIAISVDVALITILGGIGTLLGPLFGAVITLLLQEFLKDWLGQFGAGAHLVVYGSLLVIIVMLLPQGTMGILKKILQPKRYEDHHAGG